MPGIQDQFLHIYNIRFSSSLNSLKTLISRPVSFGAPWSLPPPLAYSVSKQINRPCLSLQRLINQSVIPRLTCFLPISIIHWEDFLHFGILRLLQLTYVPLSVWTSSIICWESKGPGLLSSQSLRLGFSELTWAVIASGCSGRRLRVCLCYLSVYMVKSHFLDGSEHRAKVHEHAIKSCLIMKSNSKDVRRGQLS